MTFTEEVSKSVVFCAMQPQESGCIEDLAVSLLCGLPGAKATAMRCRLHTPEYVTWHFLPCLSCAPTTLFCYRRVV